MSTPRAVLLGTLVVLALGMATVANAVVTYDATLEWTGPYFRIINAPTINQLVDNPAKDLPFSQPVGVVAREHPLSGRDVVYVLDSGNNRVQAFEANGTYTSDNTFTWTSPAVTHDEYDATHIFLHEWAATATNYVIPGSEVVVIDGDLWTRVNSLTNFTSADKVYTLNYSANTNAPEIVLPAGSLTSTSAISLKYAISNDQTGAVNKNFGVGDVDYGIGAGTAPVLTKIDGSSGGPTSWQSVQGIALLPNPGAATSDDIFLLDAADNSAAQNEKLFYYTVTSAGIVTYDEAYGDVLANPYGLAVATDGTAETAATVSLDVDTGPFDKPTASVSKGSEVTGHIYDVSIAGGVVTVTDRTTGRPLIASAAFANLANPFLGIPGLSLPLNAGIGTTAQVITTGKDVPTRYLFVSDTGGDRVKVISCGTAPWLPGNAHTMAAQPATAGNVGKTADVDYDFITPATPGASYSTWTNAFPIMEGTLPTITFDPTGTPVTWTRIDNLATAGPNDHVYTVNWTNGKVTFGDGIHGAIPPGGTYFRLEQGYTTTPDVIRYGSSGTGSGRFSNPRGIAARYNSDLGYYDVYVADAGNNRIQKFAFHPAWGDLPARMDYVCEWNTASTVNDVLNNPTDIAVALDNQVLAASQTCYLAVSDQGNHRVCIFNDTAAMNGGGTVVPVWDVTLGSQGNSLGTYVQPNGLTFLQNLNNLDIYVSDAMRGTVTKYEQQPTPSIALSFTGAYKLGCFPPTSSYTFSFTTTNAPSGGTIDFYYDTADVFDATTAKPCLPLGSTPSTATSATWTFANSPGGTPPDNAYYILYAQMKDANGSVVATDQSVGTTDGYFCIDSNLLPGLQAVDAIDGDTTLLLQNGAQRVIQLQVAYPDSIIGVGFGGTFEPSLATVNGITDGHGWAGLGGTPYFNQSFDNANGTYLVSTSLLGGQVGLVDALSHNMALISITAADSAVTTTTRFRNSTLTILTSGSSMKNIHGASPSAWVTKNLNLRFAYLGDLATTGGSGIGTDSTSILPHLAPKPDGKIDFTDQMVFTLGWNGSGNVQDRIADIGPTTGTVPNLISQPDGLWDVNDVLAFTVMYSWYNGSGVGKSMNPSGNQGLVNRVDLPRPVPMGSNVASDAKVFTVSQLASPKAGELMTVDLRVDGVHNLMGALLNLGFDPSKLDLIGVDNGGFLNGSGGSLFFNRAGDGWVEVSASRLDQKQPGVDGSGTIAHLTFRILNEAAGDLSLNFDLRSANGTVLARGTRAVGPFSGGTTDLQLLPANPNPTQHATNIIFSLPQPGAAALVVFDVSGRRVRSLVNGPQESGFHVVAFDGRNDAGSPLPSGIYFYRLEASGKQITNKLTLTR